MNNSFVSQLFLDNEQVLKEVNDAFIDVEVVKLSYHGLLIFKVLFVSVDKGISLVDDGSNIIEHLFVHALF